MPSPTTPAPTIATRGFLAWYGKWSVRSGSIRWNDPDSSVSLEGFQGLVLLALDLAKAVRRE
jgi:hypothetical protein